MATDTSDRYRAEQNNDHDSQKIRRDIEHTRHEMDDTLERIGERLHPKHFFEYGIDYIRSSSSHMSPEETGARLRSTADDIVRKVRRHPLPAALVGAGVLWWLLEPAPEERSSSRSLKSNSRQSGPDALPTWHPDYDWSKSAEDEQSWTKRARDTFEKIKSSFSDSSQSASDKLRSASSSIMELSGLPREQIRERLHSRWADLKEHSGSFVDARTGQPYGQDEEWDYLCGAQCVADNQHTGQQDESWTEKASAVLSDIKETLTKGGDDTRETLRGMVSKIGSFGNSVSRASGQWRQTVVEGAKSAWHGTSSGAQHIGGRAQEIGSHATERLTHGYQATRDRMSHEMDDHPLAAGAAALGLGMLIGFLIPRSRTEDRLMGATADDVRDRAMEKGEELLERGKEVARDAAQTVKREAAAEGISVGDLADKAERVAKSTLESAKQSSGKSK